MVMFSNTNYFTPMDQFDDRQLIRPMLSEDEQAVTESLNLGTAELGTTTNPMGNAVASVKERVMEGAGRLEFEFIGQNKGNSQQPTPESYGSLERQDMRELLTINDIKTSVHASVHGQSLAGFGQNGFSGAQREAALKEINRAIDFAGDVTDGGAIVFHLNEWQRPLSHAGEGAFERDENKFMFRGYEEEDRDSAMLLVDKRTGKFIENVQKDTIVYEPVYREYKDQDNKKYAIGEEFTYTDNDGNKQTRIITGNEWVNIEGEPIFDDARKTELFDRIPEKDKQDKTHFATRELRWKDFVDRAADWNSRHKPNQHKTPEEIYAQIRLETQALQARGSSLYHGKYHDRFLREYDEIKEKYDMYKDMEKHTPKEKLWRLRNQFNQELHPTQQIHGDELPSDALKRQLDQSKNELRYVHEASSAADAQAKQTIEIINNLQSAEEYGMEKTADTIATVGMTAMEISKAKKLKNPLYAAPENYDQRMYGSHPDEMRRIISESRKTMAKKLMRQGYTQSEEEAAKMAKQHIKATLDIGHLNMWRQHYNPSIVTNPDEKDPKERKYEHKYKTKAERDKAFEKWMLKESESLVKEGYVGHVHLSDNFGFDDEHITPGQGNVPMKEFLKRMEKADMKEMIIEPGSFNPKTSFTDTLALVGSPIYGVSRGTPWQPRFNQMQHGHFGYNAPPMFTGGQYVPSNDWRPWSEIPLE